MEVLQELSARIEESIEVATDERIADMQRDAVRAADKHTRHGVTNAVRGAMRAAILSMRNEVRQQVRDELVARAADQLTTKPAQSE